MAMAEQRSRVLVVDADMRRGALHKAFKCNRAPGLSEALIGRAEPTAVIQSISFEGMGNVDFISTGTIPPNPAELLGGERFLAFLKAIEPVYDVILFDSPPVNSVSDSLLIAGHMDGVLLVARGGKTDRSGLRFAQEQLLRVRARILGAILNDYDIRLASYYGGYYDGYYGEEAEVEPGTG
jgi:capsular exopolysaccharide synthesis family protein